MRRLRGHGCIRILLLARLVCVASTAGAQIQNGEIVGLVADPSGAVLVNATVNIRNLETDRDFEVRTNETADIVDPASGNVLRAAEEQASKQDNSGVPPLISE